MNQGTLFKLSAIAFLALPLWGKVLSALGLVDPDGDQLTVYLLNKGLYAGALLAVLAKWDGLRGYGFERIRSGWFLLPAAPFLVLTALLLANPEARYGLPPAAALGWILVAILVGIGEEGLCRGLLWRALEKRGLLTTGLLTSMLFGALHLPGVFADIPWPIVASQAVFAAGGGMIFAAVRVASGTVLAPILLHALFDACALISAGGVQEVFSETMSVGRLLGPGIVFFVWGLVWVLALRRRRRAVGDEPFAAVA